MEPPLRRQRWLGWVAAVLVVLTLFYYIPSWWAVGVCGAAIAALILYQSARSRERRKPANVYCLNCGETLNPNARQCASCGSTRWTARVN
jgi:hypothetical protein